MLRLGSRNQHCRRHDKIHPPKFLMPGDVLRGDASRTLRDRIIVARLFFWAKFVLRMSIQISPIAAQGKHEQQFGVRSRRGHLSGGQELDCRTERVAKKHPAISTQASARECFRDQRRITAVAVPALPAAHFDFAAAVVAAVVLATTAREFSPPVHYRSAGPAIALPGQAAVLPAAAPAY
jgi:hypothetical protein